MLKGIQGVLLDLSGTLYSGNERIEGTRKCLAELNERGIEYRFLTNTTTKSRSKIREKLASLKVEVDERLIITPMAAAREQIRKDGYLTANILVHEDARDDLGAIDESDDPDVVILGDLGDGYTYEVLNKAFRQLSNGAAFYALAKNRFFESNGELFLDMGAYVEALSYASHKQALCLGKPSETFFDRAVESLDLPKEAIAVVGDDLESDVLGAMDYGMKGVLVRTGKFSEETIKNVDREPDYVIDSIRDLPRLLD
ncbi:TIGR01458 family HAD-type hydrolase [Puniceicoccus vermicola]|uniref:Haloacid dehalogenase-like hydrolase domain-containing protein 2 n=1 Tax=Puniceicoccus vermicola TaxID=388746 RepID=A0A7X1AX48_9BACT|nr:TIGR01458 family HAD-type hydrolase [Puniceicoccus vermicola]MBC2601529.1 TIGR01458 family HAD-type hydrolase [Puniceicoccus vermicola]